MMPDTTFEVLLDAAMAGLISKPEVLQNRRGSGAPMALSEHRIFGG
jgi:hypothetical protein